MNKWLKRILLALGVLLVAIGAFALYIQIDGVPKYTAMPVNVTVEATPARLERGKTIVHMLCAGCHYDQKTNALTGHRMIDIPTEFGVVYSRNITKDPIHGIGKWRDGDIVRLLRTGLKPDGQYVPPYMVKLPNVADEDIYSIIAFLRSDDTLVRPMAVQDSDCKPSFLAKFLSHVAFKPLPMPTKQLVMPAITDKVAYGSYIVNDLVHCYGCHSEDFKTMDVVEPRKSGGYLGGGNAMTDIVGRVIHTPNITMDKETGIGSWSEAEFVRAVREGFGRNGQSLQYPMERFPELTEQEVSCIYEYLKTVPVMKRKREATAEYKMAVANATDGQKVYYKYSCFSCHGDAGVGVCDLTDAGHKYQSNEQLIAWIRDPSKIQPGSKMPTWNGVIKEEEYAPLAEYVRQLGERAHKAKAQNVSMR